MRSTANLLIITFRLLLSQSRIILEIIKNVERRYKKNALPASSILNQRAE